MAATDAQKRAKNKYLKEKCRQLKITIYPTEGDIREKVDSVPSYSEYIKTLIRADIERS